VEVEQDAVTIDKKFRRIKAMPPAVYIKERSFFAPSEFVVFGVGIPAGKREEGA
jgi:hypothetical protein